MNKYFAITIHPHAIIGAKMLPEDPKQDMAKILLVIFLFVMVFFGHASKISPFAEKKEKSVLAYFID